MSKDPVGPPMYRPCTDRRLEQRDETGNEEDGTQNFADILRFSDAHGWCDDQRHAQITAKTRQTVLQTVTICSEFLYASVL